MKTTVVILPLITLVMVTAVAEARPWRWEANQNTTYGWQLMTPEERTAHQTKMRSFTDYAACTEYLAEHRRTMEERAAEKKLTLPPVKRNPCDVMKARGILK